jgi:hypothetical protein
MRGNLTYLIFLFFVVIGLHSCYKDPFLNDKDFLVGKWRLVRVQTYGNIIPVDTNDHVIHHHFEFEIEKKGIWRVYLENECVERWKVRDSNLEFDIDHSNGGLFSVFFINKFRMKEFEDVEFGYRFQVNETRDTLVSRHYPSKRLYDWPPLEPVTSHTPLPIAPIFTFVKAD